MRSRPMRSSHPSRASSEPDESPLGTVFASRRDTVIRRTMHVVFFTSSFPAAVGGVDMVLVRRARELARHAGVTAVVPTPWVPRGAATLSSRWARHAAHARTDRKSVV